ncbi:MAG: preprotein translocase subunit SecY [Clostridia bacterium]|nr:preprotein translocase subunit SecY [Clostridia bacterium]
MWQTIVNAFKIKEVRRKILITLALLFVYRLGCYIPVPGVHFFNQGEQSIFSDYTFLQIMSGVSGGALQYGTFFAMGIGPYINASIIIQLLTVGIPALERLSKQGEEGRKKINTYTRIMTLFLAVAQAIGILVGFKSYVNTAELFGAEGFGRVISYIFLVLVYTAGAALTMWLGERITDYGVSNGISMLIFAGILSTAGTAILGIFTNWQANSFWVLLAFVLSVIVIFGAIVTVESAERKIPVQYAKQVKGRKMYGGQSTHIPIKVNASGVMPLIFAYAILSFPDLIMNLFGLKTTAEGNTFYDWWTTWMGTGGWIYMVILCVLILFFSYFYNQIQFNPDDISKSIQSNGGFIPGTRPGKPTADYLRRVSNRITLFGAIYLALVALVPSLIFKIIGSALSLDNALISVFSATGLLIVVSVALEFDQALQSQIMMKNYKGFLK